MASDRLLAHLGSYLGVLGVFRNPCHGDDALPIGIKPFDRCFLFLQAGSHPPHHNYILFCVDR